MVHPGSSTDDGGHIAIISLPAPPWEKPISRLDVMEAVRSRGGMIRGEGKTPHNK